MVPKIPLTNSNTTNAQYNNKYNLPTLDRNGWRRLMNDGRVFGCTGRSSTKLMAQGVFYSPFISRQSRWGMNNLSSHLCVILIQSSLKSKFVCNSRTKGCFCVLVGVYVSSREGYFINVGDNVKIYMYAYSRKIIWNRNR